LGNISLSGPTYFHELLKNFTEQVKEKGGKAYTVIMIMTDGQVDEKGETIKCLV